MDFQIPATKTDLQLQITKLQNTVTHNANFFLQETTELQDRITTANRLIREIFHELQHLKQNA